MQRERRRRRGRSTARVAKAGREGEEEGGGGLVEGEVGGVVDKMGRGGRGQEGIISVGVWHWHWGYKILGGALRLGWCTGVQAIPKCST